MIAPTRDIDPPPAVPPREAPPVGLRDEFAKAAMAARLSAGWTNPGPTNQTYREWKENRAPDTDADYLTYIAEEAYRAADAMLKARMV